MIKKYLKKFIIINYYLNEEKTDKLNKDTVKQYIEKMDDDVEKLLNIAKLLIIKFNK